MIASLLLLLLSSPAPAQRAQPAPSRSALQAPPQAVPHNVIDADELWKDLTSAPDDNGQRQETAASLLKKAGADEVLEQPIGSKKAAYSNVYAIKKGKTDKVIFLGSHYDKVEAGHGILDNWSGVVIVAALYKALKDVPTRHTIIFAAFGEEEDGLIGSKALVRSLSADKIAKIDAMAQFDTFGRRPIVYDDVHTTPALAKIAEDLRFGRIHVDCGTSDQAAFARRGVPVMLISGITCAEFERYGHSAADNASNFIREDLGPDAAKALELVERLDQLDGRPVP